MNIEKSYVAEALPKHEEHATKGDVGRTLVIAGSEEMLGAAIFAAGGALRSGSGLVYLCTDPKSQGIIQGWVPEVICTSWDRVKQSLSRYQAIAVGPGMGTGAKTQEIMAYLLEQFPMPMVIDADGLNVISENVKLQELLAQRENRGFPTVLTPHFKEAKRLCGFAEGDIDEKKGKRFGHDVYRRSLAKQLKERYNATIVMKGAGTIVYQGGDYFVNTTGNVGMATAGAGDVLAGVIASFIAQGLSPLDGAICGVYVHGMAGDRAAEELGNLGMLARDIMGKVSYAIKALK